MTTVSDPPSRVTRQVRRRRTFTWLGVGIGVGSGFLAGVLLVAALGGAKPAIHESTVTVRAPAITNGGTVVVKTLVPDLTGQPLDVARERLSRAGFDVDVQGGDPLFGIIVESNWMVVAQAPAPGGYLEQGSTVRIQVEHR